jgi:SAM-dependent methyltransferase
VIVQAPVAPSHANAGVRTGAAFEDRSVNFTRLLMYRDLAQALCALATGRRWLSVSSDPGPLLNSAGSCVDLTRIAYPEDDWQQLRFPDGSFSLVFSDQVLEHVADPSQAIRQTRRVLSPGGLHVCTSCAFNPVHCGPRDYWRFMPDGLRAIHEQNGFRVVRAGSWGSAEAVIHLARGGTRELTEQTRHLAERNDPEWPIHVWTIAEAR